MQAFPSSYRLLFKGCDPEASFTVNTDIVPDRYSKFADFPVKKTKIVNFSKDLKQGRIMTHSVTQINNVIVCQVSYLIYSEVHKNESKVLHSLEVSEFSTAYFSVKNNCFSQNLLLSYRGKIILERFETARISRAFLRAKQVGEKRGKL